MHRLLLQPLRLQFHRFDAGAECFRGALFNQPRRRLQRPPDCAQRNDGLLPPVGEEQIVAATFENLYPPEIRSWIERHGGLSPHILAMRGKELTTLYDTCPEEQVGN